VSLPVSLTIPQFSSDPRPALDLAGAASDLGLAGLFVFDHLVPLGDPTRPVLEGACCLGAMAAVASVRVGSLVTRVTLRAPAQTADVAAALASIAPGRSVLGLGVGDRLSEEEAVRYGMDRPGLSDRLNLLEETIELVRVAAPGLPIWVGGRHPRVREIAARRADGWNAWAASLDDLVHEAEDVRTRAGRNIVVSWGGAVMIDSESGPAPARPADDHGLVTGSPGSVVDSLGRLKEVVDELVVSVLPNRPEGWQVFRSEILTKL
jgi:alkanesulfonate monooxygenase SsuD/methylene tetrahydromethanopterin reductase-like flavin-dependent oxidoreductase (luciferase family)